MSKRIDRILPVGPRSVLFGAHCWFIHPWFVAAAWWKLFGFPWDPRLWVAFFVHDLGYLFYWCPNMDGEEGERHPVFGADLMHILFDKPTELVYSEEADEFVPSKPHWHDLVLYHSRFLAKRDGKPFSELCVADKLAMALEPWWLYLPRVWLSGELREYMDLAEQRPGTKYHGEKRVTTPEELQGLSPVRAWHLRCANYCRNWAYEHADGRTDTWTPSRAAT